MGNNKDWDDIPYVTGDCIRDTDEWNDMINYVRHSSCTDFTIYGTCPSTNQAFRFTQNGTDSQMFGGDDTGDDLHIWGNDNATAINIALLNTGEFKIFDGATEALKVTYAGGTTTVEGGGVTGNISIFKANSIDAFPYIRLTGNSAILYTAQQQHDWNIGAGHIARMKATGGGGSLHLKESTTPAAIGSYGAIYCKADNHLYFQDGAGVEHQVV